MSAPNTFFPDGFNHGGEMSDDLDLDRSIYPEREAKPPNMDDVPVDTPYEEWAVIRERREEAQRMADTRRDRDFAITEGNLTGAKPGPPRTVE